MFLSLYHFFWSLLGALFFGFPSNKIFVLGVTGTKGKSTVLELINAILETAGKKTALLSSIRIKIDKQSQKNYLDNTMPGRAFIQRFLRQAVKAGCDYALIEVTSQGILQHRHRFIDWDAAMFLNLAPEHIEAHRGFENYRQAKLNFFKYVKNKLFFINKDDPNAQYFIEAAKGGPLPRPPRWSSSEAGRSGLRPREGGKIVLYSKNQIQNLFPDLFPVSCFLFPENIAAAVSFCQAIGIDNKTIKKAIENFPGVPGRMEIVQKEPFAIIIDYAHTPDSLEKVYQTINSKLKTKSSKLVCVLGSAGGGRDKWKRPKMGEIAGKYCGEIILSNEDPYNENPLQIINDIENGFSQVQSSKFKVQNNYWKILDRKEAIKKALSLAKKGDVVIITGKGCEPWLHLEKGKKIPWDERKIVEEIIKETKN